METIELVPCKDCEGKGYYDVSHEFDGVDASVPCMNCFGKGYKDPDDLLE